MFKKKKDKETSQIEDVKEIKQEEKDIKTDGKNLARGKKLPDEISIDVYKWLKIIQSLILVVLGVVLIITSVLNNDGSQDASKTASALGYAIGSVLTVYGLINVLAGYLLFRTPFGQEIPAGVLAMCFAIVFFCRPNLIDEMLPFLIMTALIAYCVIMIIYGLDSLLWKSKKHTVTAITSFILATVFLAISITYIVLWNKSESRANIEKWITIVVGAVFIVVGIFSLVNTLRKIKNTKNMLNDDGNVKVSETEDAKKSRIKVYRNQKESKKDNETVIEASYEPKAIEDKNSNDPLVEEDENEKKE